jgi:hypothetical protein
MILLLSPELPKSELVVDAYIRINISTKDDGLGKLPEKFSGVQI